MKAVAMTRPLPIEDPAALIDIELPVPVPAGRDLLVRVAAVSVNPVDTKVRLRPRPEADPPPKVLGWDAAGVVEAAGPEARLFRPGDAVFYAGDVTRPGSNAELQLVDERIVGRKPARLSFAEAAALPLTALTAWEALFERLRIDPGGADRGRRLLVIAGAGGVGSLALQLARRAGLAAIATASRPESADWCRRMGAGTVIDHRRPLRPQLEAAGLAPVDWIASFADAAPYWPQLPELVRPFGAICLIVGSRQPLDLGPLQARSAGVVWEMMFTKSMFATPDIESQHAILDRVAGLIDERALTGTLTETLGPIDAATLRAAHARLESGRMIGKLAVAGWPGAPR